MREIKNRQEIFMCQCHSPEHQFIFELYDDEEHDYIDLQLYCLLNTYLPWYKRVLIAFKYICGNKSRFGIFDEVLIKPDDIPRIESILNEYKEKKCLRR